MKNYTCKLPLQGCSGHCILKTEWFLNNIEFKLYYDGQAWIGQLNEKDIEKFSGQLSMVFDEYLIAIKSALLCHDSETHFIYSIDNGTFSWTKCVGSEMEVKFGYVELKSATVFEIVDDIMKNSVELNAKYTKDIENLESANRNLSSKYEELLKLLESERNSKQEMESGLYCRFINILNKKKERINELEKKLNIKDTDSDTFISPGNSQPNDLLNDFHSDTEPECEPEKVDSFYLPQRQKKNN